MLGFSNKAARVGDQIDAEAKAGASLINNALIAVQQLDFYEQSLAQFASIVQQHDPSAAMQFQMMQQQINNTQTQIVAALKGAHQSFANIDGLTNRIQN
jgi:hypothetical protein